MHERNIGHIVFRQFVLAGLWFDSFLVAARSHVPNLSQRNQIQQRIYKDESSPQNRYTDHSNHNLLTGVVSSGVVTLIVCDGSPRVAPAISNLDCAQIDRRNLSGTIVWSRMTARCSFATACSRMAADSLIA